MILLRENKLQTTKVVMLAAVKEILAHLPEVASRLQSNGDWDEGKLRRWLMRRFLQRPGVTQANPNALDAIRSKWGKSLYLLRHFEVLQEVLVDAGIATRNVDGKVRWVEDKRWLVSSGDECRLKGDVDANRKSYPEKILLVPGAPTDAISSKGGASTI